MSFTSYNQEASCHCCRVGQQLMAAAGVSGIPHSLVVDSGGTIQFSGHPADPAFTETIKKARQ